jgi:hypothetical protein
VIVSRRPDVMIKTVVECWQLSLPRTPLGRKTREREMGTLSRAVRTRVSGGCISAKGALRVWERISPAAENRWKMPSGRKSR